jgi:uncharacterized protein
LTADQIILVGIVVIMGSALQSAVGFGYGLFAIPVMLWLDVSLPFAVIILTITTAAQMGWSCWSYRADLQWRPAIPMVLVRLATLPIGVLLLTLLASTDDRIIRQVVGVLLLGVLILQCAFRPQPRPRVHPGWTLLAGSSSGILSGLIGMGGPPIVLWLMAHDWPPRQTRSFLWLAVLLLMPVNLTLLWLSFGDTALHAAVIGLTYVPLAVVAAAAGLWAGNCLSRTRLRAATLVLLTLIAMSLILSPLLP